MLLGLGSERGPQQLQKLFFLPVHLPRRS
jgi:hypothetical protein